MYQESELEISKTPHGTHNKRNTHTFTSSVDLEETSASAKANYSGFPGKLFQLVVFAGFVCFKRERAQRRKIKIKKYFIEILDQHLNTVFLKLSEDNQSVDQENTGSSSSFLISHRNE